MLHEIWTCASTRYSTVIICRCFSWTRPSTRGPSPRRSLPRSRSTRYSVLCTALYCTALHCTGGAVLQGAEAGPLRLLQLVRGAGGVREDGQGVLPLHLHIHLRWGEEGEEEEEETLILDILIDDRCSLLIMLWHYFPIYLLFILLIIATKNMCYLLIYYCTKVSYVLKNGVVLYPH